MSNSILRTPQVRLLEEDVFTKYQLKVDEVLDEGMCGEIVLAIPVAKPEARRVVKKFTLLDEELKITNMQAFETEVQFMQSFDHPYITKCLIAAQCTDYLAICMYYYPRGTLDSYVGHLTSDLSELCISQVACALRYLHKHKAAHLDVKLDNIFLDADFNVILGDFGLAIALEPGQTTVKKSDCGGTTCYYAPERKGAAEDKQLDPFKMDAFSLGVVMWALVLEKDPDDGIDYYYEARKRRDLPEHTRELLLKLLDRRPAGRLTMAGFLSRLRRNSIHRRVIDIYRCSSHLDVKLDNIFLDADFNAILGDFGLAIALEPGQTTVKKSDCGGTTCYYAPERKGAAEDKQLDPFKMDAFSLGVVMWALVLEKDPDDGIDYYYEARKRRDLPEHTRELLLKLLDRRPAGRLTMAGFLSRLRRNSIHRRVIDSN